MFATHGSCGLDYSPVTVTTTSRDEGSTSTRNGRWARGTDEIILRKFARAAFKLGRGRRLHYALPKIKRIRFH